MAMAGVKQGGRSLGGFVRRPAVWGFPLAALAIFAAGIGLGRLVLAPSILASNSPEALPTSGYHAPAATVRAPSRLRPARAMKVAAQTPAIEISVVQPERKRYRRRHEESHREEKPKDVVFHAPKDAPSFGDPVDNHPQSDDSADRTSADHDLP